MPELFSGSVNGKRFSFVGTKVNRRRQDPVVHRAQRRSAWARAGKITLRLGLVSLVAGALFCGGRAAWRFVCTSPAFGIGAIVIEETPAEGGALGSERVRAISGLTLDDNFVRADLVAAQKRLLGNPWVRSTDVRRAFPKTVQIRVQERRAVAYVELSGLYLIDEEGQVFKRATAADQLDLPTLTGFSRQDFLSGSPEVQADLKTALSLVAPSPGVVIPWDPSELSEVHYDEDLGFTLQLGPLPTAVELGFGPFEEKLQRLSRTRGELAREKLRASAVYLDDARQPDHVGVALAGVDPPGQASNKAVP